MRRWFVQTRRERAGSVDGVNLFFGALIGANLGTLEGMDLRHYAILIALLAGTVTALRLVSLSDRRGLALTGLATWLALLGAIYVIPALAPAGLQQGDLDRLAVTILIWVGAVLTFELSPIHDREDVRPEAEPPRP